MSRRGQSRTLVASAVLLACLTLAAQSYAQVSATASAKQDAPQSWTTLLAHAQRILATDATRIPRSLSKIHAALDQAARVSVVPFVPSPTSASLPVAPADALWRNECWMRTSRAWAS